MIKSRNRLNNAWDNGSVNKSTICFFGFNWMHRNLIHCQKIPYRDSTLYSNTSFRVTFKVIKLFQVHQNYPEKQCTFEVLQGTSYPAVCNYFINLVNGNTSNSTYLWHRSSTKIKKSDTTHTLSVLSLLPENFLSKSPTYWTLLLTKYVFEFQTIFHSFKYKCSFFKSRFSDVPLLLHQEPQWVPFLQ